MLVSENKRREWNISLDARVLQLCLLDYTTLARLRINPELSPHERRRIKLMAFCPKGRMVYGNDYDCAECKHWIKTMFSVIVCRYPRRT
jgi:hypothetical protein